jgi:hypothetical protein
LAKTEWDKNVHTKESIKKLNVSLYLAHFAFTPCLPKQKHSGLSEFCSITRVTKTKQLTQSGVQTKQKIPSHTFLAGQKQQNEHCLNFLLSCLDRHFILSAY